MERARVFNIIYEAIKRLSIAIPVDQLKRHEQMLAPCTEIPYFILVGKTVEGDTVILTPGQVFQVVHVAIQNDGYGVLAARALIMSRIVAFFSQKMEVGKVANFIDPFRALIMMAGLVYAPVNTNHNPLGFDICFPFGKALLLKFEKRGTRADLDVSLKSPGLFLSLPPCPDSLNKREKNLFSKLRAYAVSTDKDKPLKVTINSYNIVLKD